MKGFTLIELLIVIAILAILTTTVVLVLNPAQMLAEARDNQRMTDLGNVRKAISLYLATATSTSVLVGPFSTASTTCAFTSPSCTVPSTVNLRKTDGNGWVGVNLGATSGGSPLAILPIDPTNGTCAPAVGTSTICQYAYKAETTNKTFSLNAVLESAKYGPKMTTDGGNNPNYLEIGTSPGLAL